MTNVMHTISLSLQSNAGDNIINVDSKVASLLTFRRHHLARSLRGHPPVPMARMPPSLSHLDIMVASVHDMP
jgi:hypothetical protein